MGRELHGEAPPTDPEVRVMAFRLGDKADADSERDGLREIRGPRPPDDPLVPPDYLPRRIDLRNQV